MNDKVKANILPIELINEDSGELIPLLSPEEEEELTSGDVPGVLPILPVRNTVLFPGVVLPITVGRKKSIDLVKEAYAGGKIIGVVAQVNPEREEPQAQDLNIVGTVARIIKMLVLPDGNTTIIIQGKSRFEVEEYTEIEPYIKAKVKSLPENFPDKDDDVSKALMSTLKEIANKIIVLNNAIPAEAKVAIDNIETLSFLTHFLSSNLNVDNASKQKILEVEEGISRANTLLEHLNKELLHQELKSEIQSKVSFDIDQQQRDYFLRQQMKVLQDELGDEGSGKEIEDLMAKAKKKKFPKDVKKHFDKEISKMKRMNPQAADYPVQFNYLDFFVDLPWSEFSKDDFDLKKAAKILDADHSGLEKVKKRIIEYLAVLKLKKKIDGKDGAMKGPILCLYGPPGVGKTSLGKSIAKALGRKYVRMALGGVRDEAEVRGHRKTYIGAMSGKVISSIDKAGTSNPVFVLDEIDKIASDFKGDPSSALLEVLDPEQNNAFTDNYLEVPYDLSKVLFIATCNSLDTIQPALRDRMEIIEVTGYTLEEKVQIAKKHLLPKQMKEHGLTKEDVIVGKGTLKVLIEGYTRESGVRGLEKKVGGLMRYVAKSIALEEEYHSKIKPEHLEEILGAAYFEKEAYEKSPQAGMVTGLAWTSVGGEILTIESVLSKGSGKLIISGQLGDVMKESAMAALTNVKVKAKELGIDFRIFNQYDLHIHVPAGAVPKDGPSAGITMFTSLASLYTQKQIKDNIAMTGEITLSGRVLPVGGIKEKILAAKRAGIKEVLMCYKNKKDVKEIPAHYLDGLSISYAHDVHDVIKFALFDKKVKNAIEFEIEEKKTETK